MAPELHDNPVLSVATDMFSFGMLMRQVLHPDDPQPFGSNAMTIMRKLDRGERPLFTRTDTPLGLKELVSRCIEHDPAKRPASMWEVHRELKAILLQLPSPPTPTPLPISDPSQPSTIAALLSQPALSPPLHSLPSASIQLVDEPMSSDFCNFVLARVRRADPGVSISRVSRVLLGGARMATYLDLFLREASSRSSNPMLRPANPTDAACVAGLNKLKSMFERTCLGASPPCNIVLAWHGTPAQCVPTSLSVTTAVPFFILSP
jgi:serine/threonine protein kinase